METLKQELNRYKQQVVKEMANKTRLAQSLDDSHKHAVELEESLEEWQITQHESQQQVEQLKVKEKNKTSLPASTGAQQFIEERSAKIILVTHK